nr:probable lysophospholipase BODYGUARD 1 [Ipomoea batatas]
MGGKKQTQDRRFRVLMLPWLAHGHLVPYLELANELHHRNFDIHFCSTPILLSSVKTSSSFHYDKIHTMEIHLPAGEFPELLPPSRHTTKDLPRHLILTLCKAFRMASPSFCDILDQIKPDLLIYDIFQPWAAEAAASREIPAVCYGITGAASMAFAHYLLRHRTTSGFPFPAICMRPHELKNLRKNYENVDLDERIAILRAMELSTKILLLNTSREIEGKYIDHLSALLGKTTVPIGSLIRVQEKEAAAEKEKDGEIMKWLDGKQKHSTLYLSFGSEYYLTREEIQEIAKGLELISSANFIWFVSARMAVELGIATEVMRDDDGRLYGEDIAEANFRRKLAASVSARKITAADGRYQACTERCLAKDESKSKGKNLVNVFHSSKDFNFPALQVAEPSLTEKLEPNAAAQSVDTSPRVRLSDGRCLAYRERGVPKNKSNYRIIIVHGFGSSKEMSFMASDELLEELGVYLLIYDRAGYGESDPNPKRSLKSEASDIEELADLMELGSKYYVIGVSLGCYPAWSCLKRIPNRLAGVALVVPFINYKWQSLPDALIKDDYRKQLCQWAIWVTRYTPGLLHWWLTQNLFPSATVLDKNPAFFCDKDLDVLKNTPGYQLFTQDGLRNRSVFDSLRQDFIVAFSKWDFDPLELGNPHPESECSVHLWQGYMDKVVPVELQRYMWKRLPWIQYHEVPQGGHMLVYDNAVCEAILRSLLLGEDSPLYMPNLGN